MTGGDNKTKGPRFQVHIEGFDSFGFAELGPLEVPLEGFEPVTIEPVTIERPLDDDFVKWRNEVWGQAAVDRACGRSGADLRMKDKDGIDIEHWVFKKRVPRWFIWLVWRRPMSWLFRYVRTWFMVKKAVFKNCHLKSIKTVYPDEPGVSVSELTISGE